MNPTTIDNRQSSLIFQSLAGLALLPVIWVTFATIWSSLAIATVEHAFWRTPQFWFFHLGIVLWALFFVGFRGPHLVYAYVFGHEWTHAFFAIASGGKLLHRPVVTPRGGQVVTDKNNVLISLSPYFVPFYAVLVGLVYLMLGFFFNFGILHERWFYGLMGFCWGFHITFTFWMLMRGQPDLDHNGRFFSLAFIVLVNLIILGTLFLLASPTLGWSDFAGQWWRNFLSLGARVWPNLAP